jgi:hypothetical protein
MDGSVPEWLKGTGCKPVGVSLRWFESNPAHFFRGEKIFFIKKTPSRHVYPAKYTSNRRSIFTLTS